MKTPTRVQVKNAWFARDSSGRERTVFALEVQELCPDDGAGSTAEWLTEMRDLCLDDGEQVEALDTGWVVLSTGELLTPVT